MFGNQQLTKANPGLGKYRRSVCSCPRFLRVFFSCFPGFSLILNFRGRLGGLGRKAGVLVRNLRTVRVAYWVNVSESSGTSLPGLLMLLLFTLFVAECKLDKWSIVLFWINSTIYFISSFLV